MMLIVCNRTATAGTGRTGSVNSIRLEYIRDSAITFPKYQFTGARSPGDRILMPDPPDYRIWFSGLHFLFPTRESNSRPLHRQLKRYSLAQRESYLNLHSM